MLLIEANKLVKNCNPQAAFVVDSANRVAISTLFAYFTGQPCALDANKGIMLCGDIGTGKTLLMKAFSNVLKHYYKTFRFVYCQDVVADYERTGNLSPYTANYDGVSGKPAKVCFDEIGRENMNAQYYGNKRNVMQHILAFRYNCWQSHGLITHGTTNANPAELKELYGTYIADRMREMFNWVQMVGESRR